MSGPARHRRWTWLGLAGIVTVLTVVGILVYRTITHENVAVVPGTYRDHDYQNLTLGQVTVGMEYLKPADPRDRGDKDKDLSRLATAYHHRFGPLGHVLERYNWFAGPLNTYWSDARLPATLVGSLARPSGPLPMEALQQLWSEPPIGVIFLQAASAASCVHPYQTIDFYERNPEVVSLFAPWSPKRTFHSLDDAAQRGANVRIFEGDEIDNLRRGPKRFYRVLIVETGRSSHYLFSHVRANVSSAALQVNEQAITDDGIICFHTSNRHYPQLTDEVVHLAKRQGLASVRANDGAERDAEGRFSSIWVMLSRRVENLQFLTAPPPRWLPQPNAPAKGGRRIHGIDFQLQN